MKVIYNKFIPFKGYKAMNLFGIVFVRKGAKFDTYDYNHEHIHLKQMQEMLWIFYYLWYAIEYLIIWFFAKCFIIKRHSAALANKLSRSS